MTSKAPRGEGKELRKLLSIQQKAAEKEKKSSKKSDSE
jgi:hypothetical protein